MESAIKTLNLSHGGKGSQLKVELDTLTGRLNVTDMKEPFISTPLTVWQVMQIVKFLETHGFNQSNF